MLCEQRHHLVTPLACTAFDERAHLEVLARPHRLRQHRVGDLTDQDVLEGELLLACESRAFDRHDDVLLAQRLQRRVQVAALGAGHGSERTLPEDLSENGSVCDKIALERGE